jgi:hypothetical protein
MLFLSYSFICAIAGSSVQARVKSLFIMADVKEAGNGLLARIAAAIISLQTDGSLKFLSLAMVSSDSNPNV